MFHVHCQKASIEAAWGQVAGRTTALGAVGLRKYQIDALKAAWPGTRVGQFGWAQRAWRWSHMDRSLKEVRNRIKDLKGGRGNWLRVPPEGSVY